MEDRSVLTSTTYSKSVLRVAAEEVAARYQQVAYYPRHEIITGSFTGGRYFAEGLRDVTPAGVSHVMRLFTKHYVAGAESTPAATVRPAQDQNVAADEVQRELEKVAAVLCDEISLDAEPVQAMAAAPVAQEVEAVAPPGQGFDSQRIRTDLRRGTTCAARRPSRHLSPHLRSSRQPLRFGLRHGEVYGPGCRARSLHLPDRRGRQRRVPASHQTGLLRIQRPTP